MPPSAVKPMFSPSMAPDPISGNSVLPHEIDVFSAPLSPPSNFMEILSQEFDDIYIDDHVIEARDMGAGTPAHAEGFEKTCTKCANYWRLETLAPVKNTKPDGSPFTKVEEHCIFGDKLFALSDRAVFNCTRFVPRKA